MTVKRIVAIACIYAIASGGWWALGWSTSMRSRDRGEELGAEVEALWGTALVQSAPSLHAVAGPRGEGEPADLRALLPSRSEVAVSLATDYRRKGLVWYPTYVCSFDGKYTISGEGLDAGAVRFCLRLPAKGGTYEGFVVTVDGQRIESPSVGDGSAPRESVVEGVFEVAAGGQRELRIAYRTRGLGEWRYDPTGGAGRVRSLSLEVTTDFAEVDYPEGCISPARVEPSGRGMVLRWGPADLITRASMGVVIPELLNPGPLTSRITFFAPVCLLFFYILVTTVTILGEIRIHPMHYLFVAAGFFSFHLLLAYLADVVTIHVAFLVGAAISIALVTTYLAAALQHRFPWKIALAGQVFFLVLFSYSFFLEGVTGLTVAIGSVITLAILMRVTAHVDWERVFACGSDEGETADPRPEPEERIAEATDSDPEPRTERRPRRRKRAGARN